MVASRHLVTHKARDKMSTLLAVMLVASFGCGDKNQAHRTVGANPNQEATAQPVGEFGETFETLRPILAARCTPCHSFDKNFENVARYVRSGANSLAYRYAVERSPLEMPPPGSEQSRTITSEERERLKAWILSGAPLAPSAAMSKSANQDSDQPSGALSSRSLLSLGRALYVAESCASCHGQSASLSAPRLSAFSKDYVFDQLLAFKEGRRQSDIMGPVVQNLSRESLEALAVWVSSESKK